MSKKNVNPIPPPTHGVLGWGPGIVVNVEAPNYLVGRLLTIVDSLGLKDNQEKAVKDLVKNEVYEAFSYERTVYIEPEEHTRLREAKERSMRGPIAT